MTDDSTTNVGDLSVDMLEHLLVTALMTPLRGDPAEPDCIWGVTVNIEGEPGVGKTSIISSLASRLGLRLEPIFAAQHPPEDFSGALIPDGAGSARQICPLGPVRDLVDDGVGIIFLDEINGAPPATQGALQSFINERRAGDAKLPGGIRMIAASNPEDIATAGFGLSPALANRLIHVRFDGGSVDEWVRWNSTGAAPTTHDMRDLEARVCTRWNEAFVKARGLVSAFIRKERSLLHQRPRGRGASGPWPSRRSWDFAQRTWATSEILGVPDLVRETLIKGAIGIGASESFLAFVDAFDLPEPQDVLSGRWKLDARRLDVALAAYASMVAYVTALSEDSGRLQAAANAWIALAPLLQHGLADVAMPAVEGLVQAGLGRSSADPRVRSASKDLLLQLEKLGVTRFLVAA